MMLGSALWILAATLSGPRGDGADFVLWDPASPVPKVSDLPLLEGLAFHVIKARDPDIDEGYNWLHGVALAWHKGRLFASFGHNKGLENTASEEARGRISTDGGVTWGDVFTMDPGEGNLAVSHGVFLSHGEELWAFQGAFHYKFQRTHTRAYLLDETTGAWQSKGVVVGDGFWPMQEPQRMTDGNYVMAGLRAAKGFDFTGHFPAVAISHGDDLTAWDLVVIPNDPSIEPESIWGESTVIVDGPQILNIARSRDCVALVSVSEDYGRTWTPTRASNLPMTSSKPYAGVLSTGQRYLVCTTAADCGNRRYPLTIAVTRPGENRFRRIYRIREDVFPGAPGESVPGAALSYPYAVEHDGCLYVGYSNDGGRGKNRNSAELAVISVEALGAEGVR